MRLKDLVTALQRTAKRVQTIQLERVGYATKSIGIEAAIAIVSEDSNWRGKGPRRKLDAVVFDPPPKPDPEWKKCWANTGRSVLPVQPGELSYGM